MLAYIIYIRSLFVEMFLFGYKPHFWTQTMFCSRTETFRGIASSTNLPVSLVTARFSVLQLLSHVWFSRTHADFTKHVLDPLQE